MSRDQGQSWGKCGRAGAAPGCLLTLKKSEYVHSLRSEIRVNLE